MDALDGIMDVLAYGLAVASPILVYSVIKTKDSLNRARFAICGIVAATALPLANIANERMDNIGRCEQLLKDNGAITSTSNRFERNSLIGQFCYNDQIRGDFLRLVDEGLETKLAYEQASENYQE